MASSKDGGVKVSVHAERRIRERLKLPITAAKRAAENAKARGKPRTTFKGRFRRYLDHLHRKGQDLQAGAEIIVYGEGIYLFAGDTLVTIYPRKWGDHHDKEQ
jgi:hypothetical protein